MNALKYSLIFLAGAGVGFCVSTFFYRKKYQTLMKEKDEELAKMDKYYEKLMKPETVEPEKTEEQAPEEEPKPATQKPEKRQGSFASDYTSYYKAADPAESEHPKEEEEPIMVSQPPKLIRAGVFGTDGYTSRILYYYTDDDALIPEGGTYDDIVDTDEVKDVIGNALIKYGFADANNMERDIFVRNFDRKTDYHIIKVIGSLSEDYGG